MSESKGETYVDFAKNSDYTRQAVELVVSGDLGNPLIRRDIARYLGRKTWAELFDEFMRKEKSA